MEYQPIYKANVSLEKKLDRQIRNLVERRPDTRLQDTTQDDNSDSPQVTPGQRTPQEPVAVEDKIIDRVPNEEALKKIFAHDGDSIEANLCRQLCSLVAAWHVGRACYITYRNRILSEYQPNRVNEALHALEWCRVLDAYPDQLPQGFEDLQQALELAEQQLFSPLIWRLCGRILQRGQWTLSPTSLIPLLSALYRQRDHNRYMLAWTLTSESEILYMTGEYRPEDCLALTPTQQALLSLAYGPVWHNTKPVPEPFRLLKEKEQRYLTAIIVYICVNAIDTNLPRQAFRRSAAKYRRKAEQSYQQELDWQMSIHTQDLNMREKGRLQRELKRSLQREKSLYATKVSHAIGEKSSINGRLDDLNKVIMATEDPYAKSLVRLVLAWMYNANFKVVGDQSERSAFHFEAAADESFPLLYLDAAALFARMGRFQQAIQRLDRLLAAHNLPERLQEQVEQRRQLYLLWWSQQNDDREHKEPKSRAAVTIGKQRHKSGKKAQKSHKQKTSAQKGKRAPSSVPGSDRAPERKQTSGTTEELPGPQPQSPQKQQSKAQGIALEQPIPLESDKDIETQESRSITVKLPLAPQSVQPLVAKGLTAAYAFLPDYHPHIRQFRTEFYWAQQDQFRAAENEGAEDKGEPMNQVSKCLEHWLKKQRVYAQVYEQACWFYLNQAMVPFTCNDYLSGDSKEPAAQGRDKREMLWLAGRWLAEAEACVLGISPGIRLSYDQFREVALQRAAAPPPVQDQQEYRKRIRSLCSSRGHIHSTLSMLPSVKGGRHHGERAHGYFTLADQVQYRPPKRPEQPTAKIAVVSQEQMEQLTSSST